jgi:Holliday junction resolvase RusA-like endonuclease
MNFVQKKRNNYPCTIANVEQGFGNALLGAQKIERFNAPVRIDIYSTRKSKTDIDNLSGKATLDGIVKAGILKDDSTEYIKEYQVHSAVPVSTTEEEETKIVITEIGSKEHFNILYEMINKTFNVEDK